MGPVYHLQTPEVRVAIAESLRVLKQKGILVVAYVNKYQGWKEDKHTGYFIHRSSEEMLEIMNSFPLEILHHIATDGPAYEEITVLFEEDCADERRCHGWLEENRSVPYGSVSLETCVHGLLVARKSQKKQT